MELKIESQDELKNSSLLYINQGMQTSGSYPWVSGPRHYTKKCHKYCQEQCNPSLTV